jgi:hypothetical protein
VPNNCTATELTIAGEGTYTLNPDGTVTFDPLPTFVGTATGVLYQVQDLLGRYASATLTPTVMPPPPPTVVNDELTSAYFTPLLYVPLDNDEPGS